MRIWAAVRDGLARRGAAVVVTIRSSAGSTPREAGTRMVVFADGSFSGTIGGGTLEWRAIAEAQRVMGALRNYSGKSPPTPPSPSGEAGFCGDHVQQETPSSPEREGWGVPQTQTNNSPPSALPSTTAPTHWGPNSANAAAGGYTPLRAGHAGRHGCGCATCRI